MAILTDGSKYATPREMAKLSAEMEVYTQLGICTSFVGVVGNFFLKLLNKPYTRKSLSYQATVNENVLLANPACITGCFFDAAKRELKKAGTHGNYDDNEAFSFAILRTVIALFGRKNFAHMSPGELADELTIRSRRINPNKMTRMPLIWFILSCLILIVSAVTTIQVGYFYYISSDYYKLILLGTLVAEVLFGLYVRRRLALTKLAIVVALLGTSFGGEFAVSREGSALSTLTTDQRDRLSRGVRAIHSLIRNIDELNLKKSNLETEIRQNESLFSANEREITDLSKSNEDPAIIQRRRNELAHKNDIINTENSQRRNTISGIDKAIQTRGIYANSLEKIIRQDVGSLFRKKYMEFMFSEDFFFHMLCDLEWETLELVEKRLLEMKATDNLRALGKKEDGIYTFSFSNGITEARIVFDPETTPVKVLNIKSSRAPYDVNMSDEQVESVLKEYGIMPEDATLKKVNDLMEENRRLEKEKRNLEEENRRKQKEVSGLTSDNVQANKTIKDIASKLRNANDDITRLKIENSDIIVEKKGLELEMQALKNDIYNADQTITSLNNEKRKLLEQLNNTKQENSEEIARINQIINHLDQQITTIINEKAQLEEDYKALKNEYNDLSIQYYKNITDTTNTIFQLNIDKKNLEEEVKKKDSDIKNLEDENTKQQTKITSLQNSNTITKGLLKKAKKKLKDLESGGNADFAEIAELKTTISKLEMQNGKYKSDLKDANETIQNNKATIDTLENDKSSLKNALSIADGKIEDLLRKINNLKDENDDLKSRLDNATICKNKSTRKLILDAINDAKEELDMSVPWISYIVDRNQNTRDDELITSIENALNRGVRIKLRYGMGNGSSSKKNNNKKNSRPISYNEIKKLETPPSGDGENQYKRTLYYVWQYHKKAKKSNGELISFKVNDHSKLMIVDKKYYIMGSLNYLSFLYQKTTTDNRGEIMIKDNNSKVMGTLYRLFSFEASSPSWD
ncbi:PLD-like domain-containing protein [Lachnospiraceae bacterium KHCPX20]|nr:PLD-like domain-containing protein [Lachnospiraceae bacterium KHCPX20]